MANATIQTSIVSAADSTDEYVRSGSSLLRSEGKASLFNPPLCRYVGFNIDTQDRCFFIVYPDYDGLRGYVLSQQYRGAIQRTVEIDPEPDAATLSPEPPEAPLVEYIKNSLAEIETSDLDDEDMPPTREAKDACIRLSHHLVDSLRIDPTLRVAAFVGENGGASLVAQSIDADRRISIDIASDGRTTEVISVDENAQAVTSRTEIDNTGRFRELACWLIEPILRKRQETYGTFAD